MRYPAEHKAEVHEKIVKDAAQRVRVEGLTGAAVTAVMRDAGLTHGGFYKHFENKEELLLEALRAGFGEFEDALVHAAEQARPGMGWKAIVKMYLSPEHCDQIESGCPVAALAPELARVEAAMRGEIVGELVRYRDRMLPFMPGRRREDKERAFFAIWSTMIGAIALARILPFPEVRAKVLGSARELLLGSFG
jgi:TetR/AcrR family transcriptional regulator, transcriptional repressor for nem operon